MMATGRSTRQEKLATILLEQKRRLWYELRDDLFRRTGGELHTQQELPQDIGDRGLLDLLADTGLTVGGIRRDELTRMEEADRKLREGTYGICDECGDEIAEERLAVEPFAVCCVKCQQRREGPGYPPGVTL